MRASQLIELIEQQIDYNEEVARRNGKPQDYIKLGVYSAPGLGKSSVFRQAAANKGYRYDAFIASLREPTDVVGGMYQDGKYCRFLRPDFIPEGDDKVYWHWDEIANAQLPMLNIAAGCFLDRMAGPHAIGRYASMAAAWNPVKSRAGSTRLPTQLLNRLILVEFVADKDDWLDYAAAAGIDASVTGFIAWKGKEALHDFNPDRDVNATPRQWEEVSKVVQMMGRSKTPQPLMEQECLSGIVGPDHAGAYLAFRRLQGTVKTVPEILAAPDTIDIPSVKEHVYATLVVLQQAVTAKNIAQCVKYVSRLSSKELEVFFMQGALKRDEAAARAYDHAKANNLPLPRPPENLKATKSAGDWIAANLRVMSRT